MFGEAPSTLFFVVGLFAGGKAPEVRDESFAIRHAVGSDLPPNTGSEDLLGTPAPDAEKLFERRAIDPRVG